jgi:hypothetical protein
MSEAFEAGQSPVYYERVVRTTVTIPAWSTLDLAEAMEILDPEADQAVWAGARPGWGATTIYAAPRG